MANNPRRQLHLDPSRVTPLGMFRYSLDFYATGIVADDALGESPEYMVFASTPVTFLIARSMELSLKALLLQQGHDLRMLRTQVGHDLEIALRRAELVGLATVTNIHDEDRQLVAITNELYSNKEFEYSVTGTKTIPIFGPLQDVAERFIVGAAHFIPNAARMIQRSASGDVLAKSADLKELLQVASP